IGWRRGRVLLNQALTKSCPEHWARIWGGRYVRLLLRFTTFADWFNEHLGKICDWLILLACVISAGNAMVRYAYDTSSNAWLEIQWYMFAVVVMFGASYTLKRNEHVRVDLFYR